MKPVVRKYQDRPIHFKGVESIVDWQFKCYEINDTTNMLPSQEEWIYALQLTAQTIQSYNPSKEELKFGYVIYHKGYDSNYIVISWWSHENMLRMFAFSSSLKATNDFRLVQDGLNICVWDMLVHAHERNAFVKYIYMCPESPQTKKYLQDGYKGKF